MLPEITQNRSLSPWRSDVFADFQKSMNHLMEDFFEDSPAFQFSKNGLIDKGFTPRMDLQETEDQITLTAELPGLTEKDVNVQLEKDLLTIKGEKREEKNTKENGNRITERRYGSFERTLRMPTTVDKDKIAAKFENGVLTVTVPKSPEAKKEIKKIAIKH